MRRFTFLTVVAAVCLLVGGSVAVAFGQATVSTDRDTYSPGDVVVITGTGWSPGEDVLLTISQDSTRTFRASYVAVADAAGEIVNADFVIAPGDTNRIFLLNAAGQTSGLTAETGFIDGNYIQNVDVYGQNPSPIYAGNSATFTVRVETAWGFFVGCASANLSIYGSLPPGVSASFSPNPVSTSWYTWFRCRGYGTLTLHTSSSTPPGNHYIRVRGSMVGDSSDYDIGSFYLVIANQPPVANSDSYSTPEDVVLSVSSPGVLSNDYDPEGGPLTAELYSGAHAGYLSLNSNGSFTYHSNSNWYGSDYFEYRARDNQGAYSSVKTVNIYVHSVNDPPVANNRYYNTDEDNSVSGNAYATDVDGSIQGYYTYSPPSHGSISSWNNSTGSFVYTPGANWYGQDEFTYRARDYDGAYSNVASIRIYVRSVNDVPVPAVSPLPTVAGSCPGPVTAPAPTANDVEDGVIQGTTSDPVSYTSPGSYTIHWYYQDNNGAVVSQNQQVVVVDETPPVITCDNITAYARYDTCVASVTFHPEVSDECSQVSFTPSSGVYELGVHEVTLTAHDTAGNEATCDIIVTVENPPPVATITGPASGALYAVDTPVEFTGTFYDASGGGPGSHAATLLCGDATFPCELGKWTVTATHTFDTPGVYPFSLVVTDPCGAADTVSTIGDVDALVVVYDPSAGFVTGGGWIDSPAGAYAPDSTLVGKANFGFVSKYQKGSTTPTGATEFRFKVADLNFHSASYDWLVIAGAQAKYKGTGTINGNGNYGFLLSATDGEIIGGGGVDRFRIKIVDKDSNAVVYDNMMGADDTANPTTALGGGSIVIHKTATGKGDDPMAGSLAQGGPSTPAEYALLPNYPNPFNPTTHIRFDLPVGGDVALDVYDVAGRLVTRLVDRYMPVGRHEVTWDGTSGSGTRVASGVYFYRIRAGAFHETRRMVMIK